MNWQTIILSLVFISYCAFSNTESVQGAQQNQSQKATRVWSDDSGTFKIEAELIKINQSSVTIKKLNGVVIDVPFARLSTTDRNFIQGQLQPATAPKKTTPPTIPPPDAAPNPASAPNANKTAASNTTAPANATSAAHQPGFQQTANPTKDNRNSPKQHIPSAFAIQLRGSHCDNEK